MNAIQLFTQSLSILSKQALKSKKNGKDLSFLFSTTTQDRRTPPFFLGARSMHTGPTFDKMFERAIDRVEAGRRFVEDTRLNPLAPSIPSQAEVGNKLVLARNNPLKEIMIPFWLFQAVFDKVWYQAHSGVDEEVEYRDRHGNRRIRIDTEWSPQSGYLKKVELDYKNPNLRFYAGEKYPEKDVNEIFDDSTFNARLLDFKASCLKSKPFLDPFGLPEDEARKNAEDFIKKELKCLVRAAVRAKLRAEGHRCDRVAINYIPFERLKIKAISTLIPGYELTTASEDEASLPGRLMSAVDQERVMISGTRQYDVKKMMALGATLATVASLASPQALGARLLLTLAGSVFGGMIAKMAPVVQHHWRNGLEQLPSKSATRPSPADIRRLLASKRYNASRDEDYIGAGWEHFDTLDLNPLEPFTRADLRKAFTAKMRVHHPDISGSDEMAAKINKAREAIRKAYFSRDSDPV